MNTDKFGFLYSPRFWNLFAVGLVAGLTISLPENIWVRAFAVMIGTWLGGSTVVRTVDRAFEPKIPIAEAKAAAKLP